MSPRPSDTSLPADGGGKRPDPHLDHVQCDKTIRSILSRAETAERERDEARAEAARLQGEVERLTGVIERDRSLVAEGTSGIARAIASRQWMVEGRGPFAYNDDRYQAEFGDAITEIEAATAPLRKVAGDLSDSPTDPAKIAEARVDIPALRADRDHYKALAERMDKALEAVKVARGWFALQALNSGRGRTQAGARGRAFAEAAKHLNAALDLDASARSMEKSDGE